MILVFDGKTDSGLVQACGGGGGEWVTGPKFCQFLELTNQEY